MYFEDDIKNMLEFIIHNSYAVIGDHVFQQSDGIPMGTICAPLLADLSFSYEAELIRNLLHKIKRYVLCP